VAADENLEKGRRKSGFGLNHDNNRIHPEEKQKEGKFSSSVFPRRLQGWGWVQLLLSKVSFEPLGTASSMSASLVI